MAKNTNKSPAQKLRNHLAEAISSRGHSPYNIWVVRPPFADEDVILSSDIAFELFYFLEGEPEYVEIDYPMHKSTSSEAVVSINDFVFAEVIDSQSNQIKIIFQHGNADLNLEPQKGIRRVTLEDLNCNAQRIENWRRIIPCIRRVRHHPTSTIKRLILLALRDTSRKSVRQILEILSDKNPALVFGAISIVLRQRYIESDVDIKPWSLNTLLWCNEL